MKTMSSNFHISISFVGLAALERRAAARGGPPSRLANSKELPALEAIVAKSEKNHPDKTRSIIITHLLQTAVPYIELVNTIYKVTAIVGVPYSVDPNAVAALKDLGYRVEIPSNVNETFELAKRVTTEALQSDSSDLLVQEVGGYLSDAVKDLQSLPNFKGIVEDTNNGHWRYERIQTLGVPVISLAQSPLKDIEDTMIGDAVIYSVERILREDFAAVLQGARAGVIGYGKIGSSTAVALRGRESVASVYDINPAKNMRARVEGFFPRPLHDLLREADLIIGATGQTSIRLVDMPHIRDGAVLASASSKDIEFDIAGFRTACEVVDISDHIHKFTRPDGRVFFLLNKGLPINFRDGSVLGTILDMIYCELFVCMRYLSNNLVEQGLHHSPPAIQDEVAKEWMRKNAPAFAARPDEKVWDYPVSLNLGLEPTDRSLHT